MASKPTRRDARERDRAAARQHRQSHESWAKRHPELARQERALRKRNAAIQRDFAHKAHGTSETHAKAAGLRQGALARLYEGGAIDIEQLAWSQQIRSVGERIAGDVAIGTVSLETRVDESRAIGGAFFESLRAVRAEVAYSGWRRAIERPGLVLAIILEDIAVSVAARRFRMRTATAKSLLIAGLDAWPGFMADARRDIDEADLLAAQAGLF